MNEDRWLQAASNLVAGMLGIFIGLAIVGFEGVEPWLYKWSTLIAGGLAVLAAFITVFQMGRVDREQAKRHSELIGMSLRSEMLKLDKYVSATLQPLRRLADAFEGWRARTPTDLASATEQADSLVEDFQEMLSIRHVDGQYRDAFDGPADRVHAELWKAFDLVDRPYRDIRGLVGVRSTSEGLAYPDAANVPRIATLFEELERQRRACSPLLRDYARHLERLMARYR